jgi:hypothetical protein
MTTGNTDISAGDHMLAPSGDQRRAGRISRPSPEAGDPTPVDRMDAAEAGADQVERSGG